MILACVEPAVELPVSMELLRLHCRIDADDAGDDAVLTLYAWAAIRQGEFDTNRVWIESAWGASLESLPAGRGKILIPRSPCTGITEFSIPDDAGASSTFPAYVFTPSSLEWDGGKPYAEIAPLEEWPGGRGASIKFKAGWPAAALPENMKQWLLVKVAGKYEQREDLASATRKIAIPFPRNFADALLDAWYLPR